jgi:hypothetical protein
MAMVRLGLLSMVVGAVALAGCSGPAKRPAAASPAAVATSAAATPSSSPALPPDLDPTKPQYHEAQLSAQIGGPAEFQTYHSISWEGTRAKVNYSYRCNGDACTDQVVPSLAKWAGKAGAPGAQFTTQRLYSCLRTSCTTSFARDGFTVKLTAKVGPYTWYDANPGDLECVAEVIIQPA